MNRDITKAKFIRKPVCVQDLVTDTSNIQEQPFHVTKVIEMPEQRYREFARNLLSDQAFISKNIENMGQVHSGMTYCLLVTCHGWPDGILINCEGYDYARYAAYIQDKSRIERKDVPVERLPDVHRPRSFGRGR